MDRSLDMLVETELLKHWSEITGGREWLKMFGIGVSVADTARASEESQGSPLGLAPSFIRDLSESSRWTLSIAETERIQVEQDIYSLSLIVLADILGLFLSGRTSQVRLLIAS